MAQQLLTDAKVYFDAYNFSAQHNRLAFEYGAEMLDATKFGDTTRTMKPGLFTARASLEGFYEAGVGKIDTRYFTDFAIAGKLLSLFPEGNAEGDRGFGITGVLGRYSPIAGKAVGELLGFTLEAEANSPLVRATLMATGAKSATGNGTGVNLGAVSATQKLYGGLHVVAASGTTPTLDVIVQSDDNSGFSSPTTRMTFSQATGITALYPTPAPGAITDTWWRMRWTLGGSSPNFTIFGWIGIQ